MRNLQTIHLGLVTPMSKWMQYTVSEAEQIIMRCWALKREAAGNTTFLVLLLDTMFYRDDVIKAYKQCAILVHPDKNLAPGSDDAFKRLTKAKDDILSSKS